jgi:EAL domain-containing protein (putative c-di-GMP-specific phosphodiesterase class I)
VCQPGVRLPERRVVAYEALARGPDLERRHAHTLVEDRELVLRAARALMLRIVGAAG